MSEPDPVEPKGWRKNWKLAFPAEYLGCQHLRGQEVTLTIARVELPPLELAGGGRRPKKERRLVIHFKELQGRTDGTPSKWLACKTACKQIELLHGEAAEEWEGKRITVWPDPTVVFGKERTGGIRVRPTIVERSQRARGETAPPESPAPAGPAPRPTPEEIEEIMRREAEEAGR